MTNLLERLDNEETCIDAIDDAIVEIKRLRAAIAQAMIAVTVYRQMFGRNGLINRLEEIFSGLVDTDPQS